MLKAELLKVGQQVVLFTAGITGLCFGENAIAEVEPNVVLASEYESGLPLNVITSYSIHYTKLYDAALQESELLVEKRVKPADPENVYLDIKGAWQLKPRELAILKPLA